MNELSSLVMLRSAIAGQSAADEKFREAVEPAKAARFAQVDKLRVDRTALGATPSEFLIADLDAL
jgi:hypothetical protein